MPFCKSDLDALESAIAQGANRVKYQDREINYRTLAEMIQTRDLMRKELGLIGTGLQQTRISTSKGLNGPGGRGCGGGGW